MKYLKMLGLAAVAAAALMAFVGAGTASATQLTCTQPAGTKIICPQGTNIHAVNEETVILHPPIGKIECTKSTVEGDLDNVGSSTTTAGGLIDALTFEGCNAEEVKVEAKGSLEIHTEYEEITDKDGTKTKIQKAVSTNNGTLTSTGAKVTVTFAGFHCIFTTNETDLGTLTGSSSTASKTATLDIIAEIPRTGGTSGIFCGTKAKWTGSYTVTDPHWVDID